MTEKYIDFDEYLNEKEDNPITLKMFGDEYKLPASPPVSTMTKLFSMHRKDTLKDEQVLNMLESLLGKEQFKVLVKNDVEIADAEWLVKKLVSMYNPAPEDADTKNEQPSTSSKNGR